MWKHVLSKVQKKPTDNWKMFLSNDQNKLTLVKLLKENWSSNSSATLLKDRKIILACEYQTPEICKAFVFSSPDGETTHIEINESLKSSQEETDTRVVLYSLFAKRNLYKNVCKYTVQTVISFSF